MKEPLIVIAGPTASGKSDLAVALARRINGEIISADSMQVYRSMDIGTAKITLEEMMGVPHYLLDVADPMEEFDVARYKELADAARKEILERGHIPILCGGTGFYIQAVTRDISFGEQDPDLNLRESLRALAEDKGNEALHEELKAVDPEAAAEIHPNNVKRVIRALEYYSVTGKKISEHNREEKEKESPYEVLFFQITDNRQTLYERIDRRVDFMMEEGLADEVRYLRAMGLTRQHVSMQGLGYKEMLDHLDGRTTLEEAVYILKRDTRHYAKRQETWFNREKDTVKINTSSFDHNISSIVSFMEQTAHERGII
ncbi:MAG: tRNA (adenosine(37)-N6)-dimethylallyltransferase MiaA [Lachnospiraceae bacterium]|nr:tRNA (adenosine(37)-N6)-dimethylallyltransferase MiaA [Lachnospiraceae bacterium]